MGGPDCRNTPNVDWSIIFDLIGSEYGYTWEQFISLTYKQLDAFLEAIARRNHNKTVIYAAMHGVKMDLYKRISSPSVKDLEKARKETFKIIKEKQAANGKR